MESVSGMVPPPTHTRVMTVPQIAFPPYSASQLPYNYPQHVPHACHKDTHYLDCTHSSSCRCVRAHTHTPPLPIRQESLHRYQHQCTTLSAKRAKRQTAQLVLLSPRAPPSTACLSQAAALAVPSEAGGTGAPLPPRRLNIIKPPPPLLPRHTHIPLVLTSLPHEEELVHVVAIRGCVVVVLVGDQVARRTGRRGRHAADGGSRQRRPPLLLGLLLRACGTVQCTEASVRC